MRERVLRIHRPGRIGYGEACEVQRRLAARVITERLEAHLLLVEHPPVITLGRNAKSANILLPAEELRRRGIALEKTDRGGDVTWHGPGQVVGYPILHLPTWMLTLTDYVRGLERAMVRACAEFGVAAATGGDVIGAWVDGRKIGSVGIHVSRGVTTHGFALNGCPDLSGFRLINPCGMPGCPMTSIEAESKKKVTWGEVAAAMARELEILLSPDLVLDADAIENRR